MKVQDQALRIGVLAPPWVPVPPVRYGGTELILDVLCRGLVERGHHVTLFTTGDSTCPVDKRWLFESMDPDRMGAAVLELRHVAAAYDALKACDIVHDHTLAGLFLGQLHPELPVVSTNHSPFNADLADLFGRTASKVPVIAISRDQAGRAPADLPIGTVIHHGLDLDRYRFDGQGGAHLVALGRMNPDKGIHLAIEVARRTGLDLAIAAKMREPGEKRYFEEVIKPKLGKGIDYVGEVDHAEKVELLTGALALVNPIQWPEPFGLVMPESLACGTPVVGTGFGAAPEIVDHGITGYLAQSVDGLVQGVVDAAQLDRRQCRLAAESRFSMQRMAQDHEDFYRSVLSERQTKAPGTGTVAPNTGYRPVLASAGSVRGGYSIVG